MPAANDPELVARLVKIFNLAPSTDLIANLNASLHMHQTQNHVWPLSISDAPNCYLCAPSVAYIDYGLEETRHFVTHPWRQKALQRLISAFRPLMNATGLDHQVQINNWMFSTGPVPDISADEAAQLRDDLTAAHPDRAIVMRSLNDICDQATMTAMQQAGFLMLPARQVYVLDRHNEPPASVDIKRDARLLRESPYQIIPAHHFSAGDFGRAAQLYEMLYLEKYTQLNPQYTARFLAQAHQVDLLRLYGLRGPDDVLDGVVGLFRNGDTITVPIIGYDTTKAQDLGLYRMLNALVRETEFKDCHYYNMSAGAAGFKRHRRAKPAIEYTAVYVRHLPWRARAATRLVQLTLRGIGVPILRRSAL